MSTDRDLADAIHHEIISPESIAHALVIWREIPLEHPEWDERKRIWFLLASVSYGAGEAVLGRRHREAARTGPWDGGHHFQEEDGYPGSLLPNKKPPP